MIGLFIYRHLFLHGPLLSPWALPPMAWLKSSVTYGALLPRSSCWGTDGIGLRPCFARIDLWRRTTIISATLPARSSALRWGPILGFFELLLRVAAVVQGLISRFVGCDNCRISSLDLLRLSYCRLSAGPLVPILIILMGPCWGQHRGCYRSGAALWPLGHHRDGLCRAARICASEKIGWIHLP